jgi:hypothetical protein
MRRGCDGDRIAAMPNWSIPQSLLIYFPDLNSSSYRITSPKSGDYNCVAWAAGIDDQQIWPDGTEDVAGEFVWPDGVRNDESVEAFIAYFESMGYSLCDNSTLEDGFVKIAIFVKDDYPTHISRQLPTGKWSSKMGIDDVDIEHDDLDCISGPAYGVAAVFLKTNRMVG